MDYAMVHTGTVSEVRPDSVVVKIRLAEDCAECAAKSFCRTDSDSGGRKDDVVEACSYGCDSVIKVGDRVEVGLSESQQWQAILLVYVVPTVLFAGMILLSLTVLNLGELTSMFAGFGLLAVYIVLLRFCFKKKIRSKYKWSVIRLL